jgi:HPr kinase/phosphorylase
LISSTERNRHQGSKSRIMPLIIMSSAKKTAKSYVHHKSHVQVVESYAVKDFYQKFKEPLVLEMVAGSHGLKQRRILEKSVNRPALALTGYLKYFAHKRLQLFGAGEMGFLRTLKYADQVKVLHSIADFKIPCMVVSRNLSPTKAMLEVAEATHIPLMRTRMKSKDFSAEATLLLEKEFSASTSLHGTLMDIKGIGVLLRGKSGVGKSECALALVERGHSLVADDLVYVRLQGNHQLTGTSAELSRGYMECRGLGIINVVELFGVRSVRLEKRIDLVISFTEWHPDIQEERTGLDQHYQLILGHKVPHMEIPLRPGRDMARLAEAAALIQALKQMGHDSANTFNERLIKKMADEKH